jgi:hypothetical protein
MRPPVTYFTISCAVLLTLLSSTSSVEMMTISAQEKSIMDPEYRLPAQDAFMSIKSDHTCANRPSDGDDHGHHLSGLESLFECAFLGRHVVFIGDSTTYYMFEELARYLHVKADEEAAKEDDKIAEAIERKRRKDPGNATFTPREAALMAYRKALSNFRPKKRTATPGVAFSAPRLRAAAVSQEAHRHLALGCPLTAYFRPHRCSPFYEQNEGTNRQRDRAVRISWRGVRDEESTDFALSASKGGGFDHALEKLQRLERRQGGQPADVVVLTGGLHYLHLWPALRFEVNQEERFDASRTLADYGSQVSQAIFAVRKKVGPGGLVVWRTTGSVCEDLYFDTWKHLAHLYRRGLPPASTAESSRFVYAWTPPKTSRRRQQGGGIRATLRKCDDYVAKATNGASFVLSPGANPVRFNCTSTMLAFSGAATLNSIYVPLVEDTEGDETLAAFRVLDAFSLTRGHCEETTRGDGRHYYGLDLGLLEMIARGAVEGSLTRPVDKSRNWALLNEARSAKKEAAAAAARSAGKRNSDRGYKI